MHDADNNPKFDGPQWGPEGEAEGGPDLGELHRDLESLEFVERPSFASELLARRTSYPSHRRVGL